MEERLASDEICVTPIARETAHTILHPPLPLPLRPVAQTMNLVTASLMPQELREDYGLRWDPARAAVLADSRQYVKRVVLPLMQYLLTAVTAARRAEGRTTLQVYRLMPALSSAV